MFTKKLKVITIYLSCFLLFFLISTHISIVNDNNSTFKISNGIVCEYLKQNEINDSNILSIGNYKNIKYNSKENNIFDVDNTYYLFKKIIGESVFKLSKNEIIDFSVNIINDYKNLAYLKNKDLELFFKEDLKKSKKEFFEMCYSDGEYEVQRILIIGKISDLENIQVYKDDVKKYLKSNGLSMNVYDSNNDIKTTVDFLILESKVVEYLKNNNVCLEG